MKPQFVLLNDMIRDRARKYGSKSALRYLGRDTSYSQLHERSLQVANALAAAGVVHGDRVAYLALNSAEYYEILLGVAAVGAVIVPVNWRLTNPEIEVILRDAAARVLVYGSKFGERIKPLVQDVPSLALTLALEGEYPSWRDGQAATERSSALTPEDTAVQLYTSGTTGVPKGAMLNHRALLAFRTLRPEDQPEWNRWTAEDVSLIFMPQFHIGGTGFGLQTICSGATGHVITEFDVDTILDLIQHKGLSKIFAAPSALRMIIQHPRARSVDYSRIRTVIYGSSPIPLDVLREAMEVFKCGFVQQYGTTETGGAASALLPGDHDPSGTPRMRSAGKPLPDVDIRIAGPDHSWLALGEGGEIAVRSPALMQGYWRLPEATSAAFTADGYFLTGDYGYIDADGYLYVQDRIKDMIVSGGENVYPAEVEAALCAHPQIHEVAVIGIPDAKWGEAVRAVIVLNEGAQLSPQEIVAWARTRLAGYKLPKSVEFVGALPRNASGKILRKDLREPFWKSYDRKVN
jgi:acyl-CoA synthetase (AMP-forming)/AMP-acid ligase II